MSLSLNAKVWHALSGLNIPQPQQTLLLTADAVIEQGCEDCTIPYTLQRVRGRGLCVAQTVNAILLRSERSTCPLLAQAETHASLLNLDIAAWFTPTSANYFGRASKADFITDLEQIKGSPAPSWNAMKKTELASLAEREAARIR